MRLAQLSNAPYQWAYHWKPALAAGLTESQLRSLESWRRSTEFDERQRKALGLAEAMYFGDVDDGQIELLHTIYDTRQILEIALTAGFYINVGRILQALQPEIDPSRRAYLP